jgi:hypothetical protein
MFLPGRSIEEEKLQRQRLYQQIEQWCSSLIISDAIKESCIISVQEVVCGDPKCAPIDTMITLSFPSYVFLPLFSFCDYLCNTLLL